VDANKNIKILLVEDDLHLRTAVSSTLARQGFEVLSAASGEEALGLIGADKFDVIISDFVMPNGDGLWLLQTLKELGLSIPFILSTGNTEVSEERVRVAGGFGLLRKPVRPQEYREMIDSALSCQP
jgi:DNA-binding NtrC family response regulator